MIRIEAVGFTELQQGIDRMKTYEKNWRMGQMRGLADKLADLVKEQIDGGGDGLGFRWKSRVYGSIQRRVTSNDEVAIMQSDEGLFVMYGTKRGEGNTPPFGLVEWCMSKLGLPMSQAYGAALGIFKQGILSRNRSKYPAGNKGFNYAEYVVEISGKPLIERYAQRMGDLCVRYLETASVPDEE